MNTGRKVFAVISVKDGKIIVDLGNTFGYEVVTTKEGLVCIVERKSQEYIAFRDEIEQTADSTEEINRKHNHL